MRRPLLLLLLFISHFSVAQNTAPLIKQWDKRFGGDSDERLDAFLSTKDGGYIIGGTSWSGKNGDKSESTRGESDYWVVKIDSSGSKQWDKRFGGSTLDYFYDLVETNDHGFLLAGESDSEISGDKSQPPQLSQSGFDYWIVKIDSIGNKQWDRRFGGNDNESFESLIKTNDKGYLLCGTSFSNAGGDKTQNLRGGGKTIG